MRSAQERVRSVEITSAVRDSRIGRLQIRKGDHIGLIDGTLKVASSSMNETILNAMQAVDADGAEIVSLFYGDQITGDEAAGLSRTLCERYPKLEIEVVRGGQPHYSYIMSVEH